MAFGLWQELMLLCLFLPFPALVLPLDDEDERNMWVRRFFVPMQVSRHDVLLSERVGAPLVQFFFLFDACQVLIAYITNLNQ